MHLGTPLCNPEAQRKLHKNVEKPNEVTYTCGGVSASYSNLRLPFLPNTPLGLPRRTKPGETPVCQATRHYFPGIKESCVTGARTGLCAAVELWSSLLCSVRLSKPLGINATSAVFAVSLGLTFSCLLLAYQSRIPQASFTSLSLAVYVTECLAKQTSPKEAMASTLIAAALAGVLSLAGVAPILARRSPQGVSAGLQSGLGLLAAAFVSAFFLSCPSLSCPSLTLSSPIPGP